MWPDLEGGLREPREALAAARRWEAHSRDREEMDSPDSPNEGRQDPELQRRTWPGDTLISTCRDAGRGTRPCAPDS